MGKIVKSFALAGALYAGVLSHESARASEPCSDWANAEHRTNPTTGEVDVYDAETGEYCGSLMPEASAITAPQPSEPNVVAESSELPRTGLNNSELAAVGASLVAVGAVALVAANKRQTV
jgi:LPXTG-motif cell wall-anchored protein